MAGSELLPASLLFKGKQLLQKALVPSLQPPIESIAGGSRSDRSQALLRRGWGMCPKHRLGLGKLDLSESVAKAACPGFCVNF